MADTEKKPRNWSHEAALKRKWKRRQRVKAKAAGKCLVCCKRDPEPGVSKCKECRISTNATARKIQARKREGWRAMGLCHRCGADAMPGTNICGYHSEKRSESAKRCRAKRIKEGKCASCGGDKPQGFLNCEECRVKHRVFHHRAKKTNKNPAVLRMAD